MGASNSVQVLASHLKAILESMALLLKLRQHKSKLANNVIEIKKSKPRKNEIYTEETFYYVGC